MSLSTSCSRSSRAVDERGERYDHSADPRRGQHPDDEVGTVGVQQSDVGALAGAQGDQAARHDRRTAFGFGVADPFGVADQKRVIAPAASLGAQYLADGDRFTRHGGLHCGGASMKCRRIAPRSGLPDGVRGMLVDDRDLGGNLVARQSFPQILDECGGVRGLRCPQFDHGDRRLAEPFVASPDDRGAGYGGVAFQGAAYVVGHDFEPAADDRLVGPADDPQEPVGVDARHVGGADPVRRTAPAAPA